MKHIFPLHVHRRTVYNSGYVNSKASHNFLQKPRLECSTIDLYIRIMNLCENTIDVVSCFNWYSYEEAKIFAIVSSELFDALRFNAVMFPLPLHSLALISVFSHLIRCKYICELQLDEGSCWHYCFLNKFMITTRQ